MPPIEEGRYTTLHPNGYDTLQDALKFTVMEKDGVTVRPKRVSDSYPTRYVTFSLPDRLKLVQANAASIAKTREALAQQYRFPPHNTDTHVGKPLRDQAYMLIIAGETYADSGNLPEASRCILDAIELGVTIPHGGGIMPFLWGTACENMGMAALNRLLEKLDAKTARAAADRLARIEQKRTPFPEILYQENHGLHHEMEKLFTQSPLTAWRNIGTNYYGVSTFTSALLGETGGGNPSLADKARLVGLQTLVTYQGPGPTITKLDDWMHTLAEQSKLPWGPQRPALKEPNGNVLAQFIGPVFTWTEFKDVQARTNLVLVKTKLRLRATFLETGCYPAKLENLPSDPFSPTRSPLKYRSDGQTFTLWSVGPDAADNGGTPPPPPDSDKTRKPAIHVDTQGDILA
ncbi:MAG: hypothetical protein QM758_07245 [Armatimonas sp.]